LTESAIAEQNEPDSPMNARRLPARCARICAFAALCGLLAAGAVRAQTTGRIEGRIRDVDGGLLASAEVLLSGPSLQGVRTARSDRDGRYWLPALPPGRYSVTVAHEGFHPESRAVTVALDAKATLDFSLQPAVHEAVDVSGASPLVDTTSSTGGTNYTSEVIARLPVQRNYADIVRSNPAVDTDRGETQGRAVALTIYGATSAENLWIVDGVNTTNGFMGIQGKAINNEFIQEVEVKTDGYAAEYGRALGGVVNVITKSGGNAFHGGGFFYYDSGATSAEQRLGPEDLIEGASRFVAYDRLDYGVDLGGYLVKDRLWFFGAFDRIDFSGEVSPLKSTDDVTTQERFPIDETDNLFSAKLTWNVAAPTTVVGTVFSDPSTTGGAAGADPRQGNTGRVVGSPAILNRDRSTWDSTRTQGGIDYGLRVTQLMGFNGVAGLQASYHRDRNLISAADLVRTENDTCDDGTADHPCKLPEVPNGVTGGHGWFDGQKDRNQSHRWQVRGDYTAYAGTHELKAGADYQATHSDMTYGLSGGQLVYVRNEKGRIYYIHEFAAVSDGDLTQLPDGRFLAEARDAGVYVQDSWKPAAGLTINAGLRWDGESLRDYARVTRLSFPNEWQPRLGIAWDPWNDGKTRAYASAGRFYFSMPTAAMTWWFSDVTGIHAYNFDPVSLTPDPAVASYSYDYDAIAGRGYYSFYGGGPLGTAIDVHVGEMYQDELTVGVERLLDPTLRVGVKASYRRLGNALEDRCDFADADGNPMCAIVNPGSGERYARGDAPLSRGSSGGPTPPAQRLYRGVELVARKAFGSELWVQASYVYSSLRGNYDGAINEVDAGPVPGRNIDFDWPELWHNAYGRLFLDRPHRFRVDAFWVLPFRLSIGAQAFAASGAPLNRLGYSANANTSAICLVPRGSVGRLPTQWEANLSLAYPIVVGPVTVTLQAYLFNAFNNQIPVTSDEVWTTNPSEDYSPLDAGRPSDNPLYGQVTGRQPPRSFRAAVRIGF
jgi:hypothetical protein